MTYSEQLSYHVEYGERKLQLDSQPLPPQLVVSVLHRSAAPVVPHLVFSVLQPLVNSAQLWMRGQQEGVVARGEPEPAYARSTAMH